MSEYAVVNPATGETVARYDSFTDAQVEQALGTAGELISRPRGRSIVVMGKVGAAPRTYQQAVGRAARPSGSRAGMVWPGRWLPGPRFR